MWGGATRRAGRRLRWSSRSRSDRVETVGRVRRRRCRVRRRGSGSRRAGPQVHAGFEDEVAPSAVGLVPVVAAAEGGEVAGAGLVAGLVGDDVVLVALLAGRVHQGKTQCRSRRSTWSAMAAGGSWRSTGAQRARSMTGFTVIFAAVPHQVRICCSRTSRLRLSRCPIPPAPAAGDGGVGEVQVEDHRPAGARAGCVRVRPAGSSSWSPVRSRVSWRRAISPTAAARRTSNESWEPRSFRVAAVPATAASRSRASARSRVP